MKRSHFSRRSLASALAALSAGITAQAANVSWDGDQNPDFSWSATSNWLGNAAPVNDGTTDIAVFGTGAAAGNRTPNLDANRQVKGLSFTTGGYTLTGAAAATLSLGTSYIAGNASGTNTISANLTNAFSSTVGSINWVTLTNGSFLTLSGTSTLAYSGTATSLRTAVYDIDATSQATIAGPVVFTNSGSGTLFRINKAGAGTLRFSASNAFTGMTSMQITAGTISAGATGAFGTQGIISVNGQAASKAILIDTAGVTIANQIQFLNGATSGAVITQHTIGGSATSGTATFNSGTTALDLSNAYADPSATNDQKLTQFTAASGGRVEFKSVIQNNGAGNRTGGINKIGGGVVALSGSNTYTLGTVVSEGTLLINNTAGSGAGSGSVSVSAGATLGGTGFLRTGTGGASTNAISVSGTLAPGDGGIGILTVNSGSSGASSVLTLEAGARLSFELNSSGPASFLSDRISLVSGAAGDIAFTSTVIDFTDLSGGSLAYGEYVLFAADVANAYSGLTLSGNTITAGLTFTGLSGYAGSTLGISGNNIVLNVIPEPSTVMLGGVGLAVFLRGFRRRRGA